MKIIQSLKTKNGISDNNGWLSPEFNLMSWALSCLQLTKLHGKVELFTDTAGENVLVDILQLPYHKVHLQLNDKEAPHKALWAYSKLVVYNLQTEPFLHIDGDVFLWEQIDAKLLNSSLLVQNLERDGNNYYYKIVRELDDQGFWLPDCILWQRKHEDELFAYNVGFIGGNDLNFIKKYTDTAFEFLEKNKQKLDLLYEPFRLNVYFEQYLLYCLAKTEGRQPAFFYNNIIGPPVNYKRDSFGNFWDVPFKTKFIHTIGDYKTDINICLMLAKRLRQDYPSYYYRILDACKNAKIDTIARLPNDGSYRQVPFFRTKANFAEKDTSEIEKIADHELQDRIDAVDIQEKKAFLQGLYNYEKQIQNHPFEYDAIFKSENLQQEQYKLVEKIFSHKESLTKAIFKISENFYAINVDVNYTGKWYYDKNITTDKYKICFPYDEILGSAREVCCDVLDIIILNNLTSAKDFETIKADVMKSFNQAEILQKQEEFDAVIQKRLKYFIFDNLISCYISEPELIIA